MEKILSIPPVIAFLALLMVVTEVWKDGIGILYDNQLSQFLSYIRDAIHGVIGGILLLVPMTIWSLIPIGTLINIIIFSFNFSRRKRISVIYFTFLLASAVVTGIYTLITDLPPVLLNQYLVSPLEASLKQGGPDASIDTGPILLLIFHVILFLLIVILAGVFRLMFRYAKDGQGAILRWLPTGYASAKIRRKGNEVWIRQLPNITVSPGPRYKSYCIVKSPEDSSAAQQIQAYLEQRSGYTIADDPGKAECDLIILSPFADDSPLRRANKTLIMESKSRFGSRIVKVLPGIPKHDADDSSLEPDDKEQPSKPIIYVLARSIKTPKDMSIPVQWIDYRRPTRDQFWKQWERNFSQLKGNDPVFPYVPEAEGKSLLPVKYWSGILVAMLAVVAGSALLIAGMEYVVLLKNALTSVPLVISLLCLLGAMSLSYYMIAQMIRGVISPNKARQWLMIAAALTVIAAFTSQSPLFLFGGLSVVQIFVFLARRAWPRLGLWLPPRSRKSNKKSLLQPISNYKAFVSPEYNRIMIAGLLGLCALITNWWVVPNIPPQFPSQPYAVTVPGPYDLAAPGLWSQDPNADALGYHFVYHPDKLEISQDHVTGYPTWLKFLGTNSYPMRFAPHFKSSIHVHFTNTEAQTSFGLVLNDFAQMNPGDLLGPQIRLTASGVWTVIEVNGNHYSGQANANELAHDYTLEVEVNGILCTYSIDGKEMTAIADTALSSVQDIMFSFANFAPSTTTYDLSNFTYAPIPGPVLSRDEAIKRVATLNSAPYTTAAPGWNCNPDDGRWDSYYEPAQQNTHLTCTSTGTRLNTSGNNGVGLNFDNHAFGGLPAAFDYSFDATFQDTHAQCIEMFTYATITTTGITYAYVFILCSNGNWAIKYIGFHTENFSIFLNKQLQSGHTSIPTTITISVEFRSTTQRFYINKQLITFYTASDLKPTIFFTNDTGPVLYSNFSYVPRTQ